MKCPFCGKENIEGVDTCENCGEDLTSFEGIVPQNSLEAGLIKDPILSIARCHTSNVDSNTSIWEVAKKMDQSDSCCLVFEGDKLAGIVTERDILKRAIFKDFDLKTTPISKIMTPNPDALESKDKIVHALNKMAIGNYRHVPIQKSDHNYQVISVRDILTYVVKHYPKTIQDS